MVAGTQRCTPHTCLLCTPILAQRCGEARPTGGGDAWPKDLNLTGREEPSERKKPALLQSLWSFLNQCQGHAPQGFF